MVHKETQHTGMNLNLSFSEHLFFPVLYKKINFSLEKIQVSSDFKLASFPVPSISTQCY